MLCGCVWAFWGAARPTTTHEPPVWCGWAHTTQHTLVWCGGPPRHTNPRSGVVGPPRHTTPWSCVVGANAAHYTRVWCGGTPSSTPHPVVVWCGPGHTTPREVVARAPPAGRIGARGPSPRRAAPIEVLRPDLCPFWVFLPKNVNLAPNEAQTRTHATKTMSQGNCWRFGALFRVGRQFLALDCEFVDRFVLLVRFWAQKCQFGP